MLTQSAIRNQAFKKTTMQTVPPAAAQSLGGPIEMMGATMSFARNAEIYGEGEPADYIYNGVWRRRYTLTVGGVVNSLRCVS